MTREEMEVDEELVEFRLACGEALRRYIRLQEKLVERLKRLEAAGASEKAKTSAVKRANEAARSVLPNGAETRMVYTTNLRALRHILLQRGNEFADLEIRRVAVEMLGVARSYAPLFFADMEVRTGNDDLPIITATWGRC
jgi:thymidylate synthase (FAD)